MRDLFIDIETYSSVDIKSCGSYKYIESPDFEILLVGFAFDDEDVQVIDLASGEDLPDYFVEALTDPNVRKHAHNAVFERTAFRRIGYDVPASQWYCTMVKAAYCGLPLGLDQVSKVLDLKDKKLDTGKALIKYFSCPCAPTKINGGRTRNLPCHNPEKWRLYKTYNKYDVLSEREIHNLLKRFEIPKSERVNYVLDQTINDRGVLVDIELAESAVAVNEEYSERLFKESQRLTGLDNPNSLPQLKNWYRVNKSRSIAVRLTKKDRELIKSPAGELYDPNEQPMTAEAVSFLLKLDAVQADRELVTVLENRQKLGKSSVKKYYAMLNCAMSDNRARGLFQFYGANRTGRWAGRLLQLQNLTKNHEANIDIPRDLVRARDLEMVELLYGDATDILSQLVRTTLVAPEGMTYCVADFSAIEARVISWLANEQWRLDVFHGDGKIYEATGSRMFNVPIECITKGSELRAKAKISELALGYEGSIGAMKRMGGDKMGMTDNEMLANVKSWRAANPKIVALWREMEKCAIEAIRYRRLVVGTPKRLVFNCDGEYLTIRLPSGRSLFYFHPILTREEHFGKVTYHIQYEGMNQETKVWGKVDTYGGKLTENVVQAIARDLIAYSMYNLEEEGYQVVMHVHDEAISEVPDDGHTKESLDRMIEIMRRTPDWASDMPLNAAGFISKYYQKD